MGTAVEHGSRRPNGHASEYRGNGNGEAAAADREQTAKGNGLDTELLPVLQEIMRLVDASKEGRLGERGQAPAFQRHCIAR